MDDSMYDSSDHPYEIDHIDGYVTQGLQAMAPGLTDR